MSDLVPGNPATTENVEDTSLSNTDPAKQLKIEKERKRLLDSLAR